MARDFDQVVSAICQVMPEFADKLERNFMFFAPESRWEKLSYCINLYIEPNSANEKAVKVYALLTDCSEDEILERFERMGF